MGVLAHSSASIGSLGGFRFGERDYAVQYEGTQLFSSMSAAMEL
jgi:hypothetical protein